MKSLGTWPMWQMGPFSVTESLFYYSKLAWLYLFLVVNILSNIPFMWDCDQSAAFAQGLFMRKNGMELNFLVGLFYCSALFFLLFQFQYSNRIFWEGWNKINSCIWSYFSITPNLVKIFIYRLLYFQDKRRRPGDQILWGISFCIGFWKKIWN